MPTEFNTDASVGHQTDLKIQAKTFNEESQGIGWAAERILPDTYRALASRLVYRTLNTNRHKVLINNGPGEWNRTLVSGLHSKQARVGFHLSSTGHNVLMISYL